MAAPAKPTITDDHKKKYEAIMGTQVKPVAQPPTPSAASTSNSKLSSLLSSLPKSKGFGDKMFIFTGKKKIIVDGTEREEEKAKTVDPAKEEREKKEKEKAEEKKREAEQKKKDEEAKKQKEYEEVSAKIPAVVKGPAEHKTIVKKKTPIWVYAVAIIVGLVAWTFIWLYVFGFIPLPGQ